MIGTWVNSVMPRSKSNNTYSSMFVFVTAEPFFVKKYEGQMSVEELSNQLLVHEYGHTIQSLMLGPLYLAIIEYLPHCGG